jgi:hypothetical protein
LTLGQEKAIRTNKTIVIDRHDHRDTCSTAFNENKWGDKGKDIMDKNDIRPMGSEILTDCPSGRPAVYAAEKSACLPKSHSGDYLTRPEERHDFVSFLFQHEPSFVYQSLLSGWRSVLVMNE